MRIILLFTLSVILYSCGTLQNNNSDSEGISYGYHPIDPLPVRVPKIPDTGKKELILKSLPDETMRIAIGEINTNTGVTFSSAKMGVESKNYVVILDYIKFNTIAFEFSSNRILKAKGGEPTTSNSNTIVPVYVGVGLRLTANIKVLKGTVDLGNLFAIGAASNAERVTGTLVVQTLGISGENISSIIPMPSEINPTTIQNAIMALGTIKSKLYDAKTEINPRVVGVYNTLGGDAAINTFISELLKRPISIDLRADLHANEIGDEPQYKVDKP